MNALHSCMDGIFNRQRLAAGTKEVYPFVYAGAILYITRSGKHFKYCYRKYRVKNIPINLDQPDFSDPKAKEKDLQKQVFTKKSARRGSNPRTPPWQGGVVPLYYSRI